jgi:ABC-type nitrate/sulfonate/bicarbonate transport system permease component
VTVSFACTAIVTVDGVETIEGQWRTAASTFTMHERTLLIVEVRT